MECQEVSDPSNGIGCYVMVVEDNGIGISEEFQKRIFQPFERAEDSRVSKIQGTGLGMSITQNLVQMMGGTIEVESQLNKGSRFTVTLSLKPADSEEEERRIKQESTDKKKKKELSGRGKRILLVEDNNLNREIARELLEMEQFEIEEARDGREAVEKFRQSPNGYYQIILMDIQMPVMNGYEAARAIRKLDREDAAEIPVIALTANAFADDIYAARQAGMNAHLSKPLDMEKVAEALERWLI